MSAWTKGALGPARSVPCRTCGARVSVRWAPALALLLVSSVVPLLTGILAAMLASHLGILQLPLQGAAFLLGGILGAAPFIWVSYRYVPLVVRGT